MRDDAPITEGAYKKQLSQRFINNVGEQRADNQHSVIEPTAVRNGLRLSYLAGEPGHTQGYSNMAKKKHFVLYYNILLILGMGEIIGNRIAE